jgi:GntR family transcriptional regulator of arabinose operon
MNSATSGERTPKHLQIRQEMQRAILSGTYTDGQKIPSELELAEKFGVSRPTMARALRDLEQHGLLQRRAGAGTYVRLTRKFVFGLLIREVGEIFDPICQGLALAREETPHELIWGNIPANLDAASEAESLCEQYVERKVSGVFWAPLELTDHNEEVNLRIVQSFERAEIPIVLLDRDIYPPPRRSHFDLVGIDDRRAGFTATEHLLENGCRRVVFMARPHSAPTVDVRIMGYRDALFSRGITPDPNSLQLGDPQDVSFVRRAMEQQNPDGVVCANDFTAAHLMRTLNVLGVNVPAQVKIVGFDDVKYANLVSPPLTTIRQPCIEMGVAALDAMLNRIKRPKSPAREILLDFKLIARQSCGSNMQ